MPDHASRVTQLGVWRVNWRQLHRAGSLWRWGRGREEIDDGLGGALAATGTLLFVSALLLLRLPSVNRRAQNSGLTMKEILILMSITALANAADIRWRDLPALPQSLAGQFAGSIGERSSWREAATGTASRGLGTAAGKSGPTKSTRWSEAPLSGSKTVRCRFRLATDHRQHGRFPAALHRRPTPSENSKKVYRLRWSGGAVDWTGCRSARYRQ